MGTLIFSIHCTRTVSYSRENENHEVDLIRTAPLTPILKVQAALAVNCILLVGMLVGMYSRDVYYLLCPCSNRSLHAYRIYMYLQFNSI